MIFGIDDHSRSAVTALFSDSREWSYGELANQVAARRDRLPKSKSLIFVFCRNTLESLVWYLAALDAGHAVALLDEALAAEFKVSLVALYQPELVVTASDLQAPGYQRGEEAWERKAGLAGALHPDLGLMLSTSGSTGSPKFVRLTRRNVEANAASICEALEIAPEHRAITSLPMNYSYGLSVVNTHLLAGASLTLTDESLMSPAFWNTVRDRACTSFAGVPYSYQILRRLKIDELRVPALKCMTQAGGKLHNDLVAHFHSVMDARGGRFYAMYGQTEATARISILPWNALPVKLGSAGVPIPGGAVAILRDDVVTREPRVSGELVYTGPNVMMGYATDRSQLKLGDELGGRLHTGDLAELDEDGYLYIAGRAKRDAKLFGLRLNLDEIENLMRGYGPTAVIAKAEKLVLFCEHGDDAAYAVYRRELAGKLNVHHAAFEFRYIERLPLNASGKVDYQQLGSQ